MQFLLRLVACFPLPVLHAIGTALGWAVYLASPRYRGMIESNLRTAGLGTARMRASVVCETGKAALEIPLIWLRSHRDVARLVVEASGWEYVDRAAKGGKGLILLTPHLGCWEISGQYIASRMPITVMYAPPNLRSLEPLMQAGRNRGAAMRSVPADMRGVRAMLKALRRGEAIGILPDQVPGVGEGEWAEFFGRPAYTMTLVGRLAEQTGAPVLLCYSRRLARARGYRFEIEPLLVPRPAESPVRTLNRSLESLILRCPEQYLWSYNRYKVPAGVRPPAS
ncbi:MAG TPA: lysophospholipid acyltransferase family protein [Burkholderiales bacterium]|nr:lysophospholipid acyltransferase family protein [Burkholderiales bacterium]